LSFVKIFFPLQAKLALPRSKVSEAISAPDPQLGWWNWLYSWMEETDWLAQGQRCVVEWWEKVYQPGGCFSPSSVRDLFFVIVISREYFQDI